MSKIKVIVAVVVFAIVALVVSKSAPSAFAAPANQIDESRNFDAVIVDRSSAQLPRQFGARAARDCRSGQLIDLSDGNFGSQVQVGHTYHFENAWVYEGNPGELFFLISNSPSFRYSEIPSCPSAPPPAAPPPTQPPAPISVPLSVNFYTDQSTISAGQCTILYWHVVGNNPILSSASIGPATENYGSIAPVPDGTGKVCPNSTTTYTLYGEDVNGNPWQRQVTVTVLQPALPPSPTPVPPSQSVSYAKQIVFMLKSGRFTSLQIEGPNQYGNDTVWQPSYYAQNGSQVAITAGWWWEGFVVISFDIAGGGSGQCQVDTLGGSSDVTLLTYDVQQPNNICGGAAGSVTDPFASSVQSWIDGNEAMDQTWASVHMDKLNPATDVLECASALASGTIFSSGCVGVAESDLWEIIKLKVTPTPPPSASTSATDNGVIQAQPSNPSPPSLPPGVFVINIRLDPNNPAHNQPVTFYVTFENTTGSMQSYRWRVYIFKADKPSKSNTETTFLQSDIPVDTGEIQSAGSFKYGIANPCDYFFAQVGWPDANNNVNFFNDTSGNVAQQGFSVCN